jgi:hypothetical protein
MYFPWLEAPAIRFEEAEMKTSSYRRVLHIILMLVLSAGCRPAGAQPPVAPATETLVPKTPAALPPYPYEMISEESLLGFLEDLTSIQPYSGWRNSASSGEAEGLAYVEKTLGTFSNLQNRGLELERQSFNVYLSTEIWDSSLTLTVDGQEINVPADGLRGNRFNQQLAVSFDSDGALNDSEPDPLTATGAPLFVQDEDALYFLTQDDLEGRILILDYSLIDRATNPASNNGLGAYENGNRLLEMVNQGIAGMVFVTHFSNTSRQSHGLKVGEGDAFGVEVPSRRIPVLYVRIEDLEPAGIRIWDDLQHIESAELTLDTDIFSPGASGNVIARIPGADPSKAVILGAHIDTPNSPGALDDGSGSAALLEIARVLNDSQIQPPVDIYLAWFGSEELGIYGSSYFVSTHQELLDHTLAMVQMDGLGSPLDGIDCHITMTLASYDRFGDNRLLLPDFLSNAVAPHGIILDPHIEHAVDSDHNNFETFDVPNLNLMYVNTNILQNRVPPVHFYVHWHDPYDDMERARGMGNEFVNMTKVMLAAALEIGNIQPDLRVTPIPDRRALIVASHTESFGITFLRELGAALSWEGFDVDLIPYGQAITPAELKDVGIVILPPALNSPRHAPEVWSENERSTLKGYVENGGFLVVVNSGYDYASTIMHNSLNQDKRSANSLLEPMGIRFKFGGAGNNSTALAAVEHPLTLDATYLTLRGDNSVRFDMKTGSVLVHSAGSPLVGLVDYGTKGGQVLVIGELGLLQAASQSSKNMEFVKNIAAYASER